jgi:hypothetical protein
VFSAKDRLPGQLGWRFLGLQAVSFYTQVKTITSNWKLAPETSKKVVTAMPTLG